MISFHFSSTSCVCFTVRPSLLVLSLTFVIDFYSGKIDARFMHQFPFELNVASRGISFATF